MSSPEFQVCFGVKDYKVVKALEEVNITVNRDETSLVDEGVFQGMYNGNGDCAEWLGLDLFILDNYSPFIDISEVNYSDNETKRTAHKRLYQEEVDKLYHWLEEEGHNVEELDLPEPEYFIACGTD